MRSTRVEDILLCLAGDTEVAATYNRSICIVGAALPRVFFFAIVETRAPPRELIKQCIVGRPVRDSDGQTVCKPD